MRADKGWRGIDFDGTTVTYNGWMGETHIGKPIAASIERIKNWLAAGEEVRIVTARVGKIEDRKMSVEETATMIQDFLEPLVGQRLPVTCEKDIYMKSLHDDCAEQVIPNTGLTLIEMFGHLDKRMRSMEGR